MIQVDKDSQVSDELKINCFIGRSMEKTAILLYILKELV
jgi:hypothetical protein